MKKPTIMGSHIIISWSFLALPSPPSDIWSCIKIWAWIDPPWSRRMDRTYENKWKPMRLDITVTQPVHFHFLPICPEAAKLKSHHARFDKNHQHRCKLHPNVNFRAKSFHSANPLNRQIFSHCFSHISKNFPLFSLSHSTLRLASPNDLRETTLFIFHTTRDAPRLSKTLTSVIIRYGGPWPGIDALQGKSPQITSVSVIPKPRAEARTLRLTFYVPQKRRPSDINPMSCESTIHTSRHICRLRREAKWNNVC